MATGREDLKRVHAYNASMGHVGLQGHVRQPLTDRRVAATGCRAFGPTRPKSVQNREWWVGKKNFPRAPTEGMGLEQETLQTSEVFHRRVETILTLVLLVSYSRPLEK